MQIGCPICPWLANRTSDMLITNLFVFAFVNWFFLHLTTTECAQMVVTCYTRYQDIRDLHLHGSKARGHTGQKPGHQEQAGSPGRKIEGRARCFEQKFFRTSNLNKLFFKIELEQKPRSFQTRTSNSNAFDAALVEGKKFMSRAAFCRPVKSP